MQLQKLLISLKINSLYLWIRCLKPLPKSLLKKFKSRQIRDVVIAVIERDVIQTEIVANFGDRRRMIVAGFGLNRRRWSDGRFIFFLSRFSARSSLLRSELFRLIFGFEFWFGDVAVGFAFLLLLAAARLLRLFSFTFFA